MTNLEFPRKRDIETNKSTTWASSLKNTLSTCCIREREFESESSLGKGKTLSIALKTAMPEVKVEILIHLFIKETYMVTTIHLYVSGLWVAHNYNKNVKETI